MWQRWPAHTVRAFDRARALTVPKHPQPGTNINPDVPVAGSSSRRRVTTIATPQSRIRPWPKELEDGFRLHKYLAAKDLTPFQWGQQLAKRLWIKNALTSSDPGILASSGVMVASLLNDPLAPYSYHIGSVDPSGGGHFRDASAASELSVDDLQRLGKEVTSFANGFDGVDQLLHLQGQKLGEDGAPVGNPWRRYVHLKIDLHATSLQIVEQVEDRVLQARHRTGLNEVRKHASSKRRGAKGVMKKLADKTWRHFNVLPLLDIEVICQHLGVEMPSTEVLLAELPRPEKEDLGLDDEEGEGGGEDLSGEGDVATSATYIQKARKHAAAAQNWDLIHELLLIGDCGKS
jgi:hypothetical protein